MAFLKCFVQLLNKKRLMPDDQVGDSQGAKEIVVSYKVVMYD